MVESKYSIFIALFLFCSLSISGQNRGGDENGTVSYVTSNNVYVKFDHTENIEAGDTLIISSSNTRCLLVTGKSSSSVLCTRINNCEVGVGDIIWYHRKINPKNVSVVDDIEIKTDSLIVEKKEDTYNGFYSERIKGRISFASYNTSSNIRDNRRRLMTRLSTNAQHIDNSHFSFEAYLNFRQNFVSGAENKDLKSDDFNIYNLSLKYDVDTTFSITVGRKINNKASSIGAIDGVQLEKYFGTNYAGIIGGFRPDIRTYGLNSDLLQYGLYIGKHLKMTNFYSQTTIGFAQQFSGQEIDRRYVYFQHSGSLFKKLNLFSSVELDMYGKVNDRLTNETRLTNLYLSGRYRISKKVNFALSFDSRKRIIYYETYQSDVERILDEDLARQGIRARVNVRPLKNVSTGFSYSKRYQSDHQNKSDNIYGYLRLSRLPVVKGGVSLTFNKNSSNYLESQISAVRYSRAFFKQKLNTEIYYRKVNYVYKRETPDFKQKYYGAYLSYPIRKRLTISLSGEYSTYELENNFRFNTRIIKRFASKRKK